MEIPLKVVIEAPDISIQTLSLERIVEEPRLWKLTLWTVNSDTELLQQYHFHAAHLESPVEFGYSVGHMEIFPEGTVYEKSYVRDLRDACNKLLEDHS